MALVATWREKEFGVGDTVDVGLKLIEGGKERVQTFRGIVISIRGSRENKSFVVRREGKVGVERIFPLISPWISDIEVVQKAVHVRRAKLYYLREAKSREKVRQLYRSAVKSGVKKKTQAKKKAKGKEQGAKVVKAEKKVKAARKKAK